MKGLSGSCLIKLRGLQIELFFLSTAFSPLLRLFQIKPWPIRSHMQKSFVSMNKDPGGKVCRYKNQR